MVRDPAMRASSRSEAECRDPENEPREAPGTPAGGDDPADEERTGEPFSSPCSMELEIGEPSVPPESEPDA